MLNPVELFPEVSNLYDFASVHADMIFDERRVDAYQKALTEVVKPGDVVVDVGTGTGLLAFLAIQAGASKVHAIERSDVIELAQELASRNGFSDKIVFHKMDARDVVLDKKADVIVSELMGHVAFEEGMAETIHVARTKLLREGGTLIPEQVSLKCALVNETNVYPNYISKWHPVKGIDYGALQERAARTAYVVELDDSQLMSEAATVVDWRFDERPGRIDTEMTFSALRPGEVNGVAFWFDAALAKHTNLSSSPWTKTHWQQCFMPFSKPVIVETGSSLPLKINLSLKDSLDDAFTLKVSHQIS